MLDVKLNIEKLHPDIEYAIDELIEGRPRTYMPPIHLRKKLVPDYSFTPNTVLIVCLDSLSSFYWVSNLACGYLRLRKWLYSYTPVAYTNHFNHIITYATDFIQFDYLKDFADILVMWKRGDEINCLSLLKMLNNEHQDFFGGKEIRREHNAWKLIRAAVSKEMVK